MGTPILRQEFIVVYQANATLHSSDNGYGSIGIPIHIPEYLADRQYLYLVIRFLLPKSDAGKHDHSDHSVRGWLHLIAIVYLIPRPTSGK